MTKKQKKPQKWQKGMVSYIFLELAIAVVAAVFAGLILHLSISKTNSKATTLGGVECSVEEKGVSIELTAEEEGLRLVEDW